ncbi:hypothetical protein AJ78_01517 [Emergomyces pasteurianus Ep9510]|uniref:Wbp11/ELF5/Saf1 N-terminal domain-containing protein n=1 Tax=Emergomyces pasteurianus Ep9510 TaxID=1447872 RepID=A0A1J9QT59_9EURO|nr:hypothetical protein AJ78_01517 [Emergomyces pasteurianus Ep9510]
MAKDKERSVNPALAQRRLEKAKALKKGKAEVQARRNEKLARRNPDRLQRQIDDLKAIEQSGQPLRPSEKQHLEELERDLRAVKKAREALGDKAPTFGGAGARQGTHPPDRGGRGGVLGKRRRDGQDNSQWRRHGDDSNDSSDTDESVRRIPMPKDTPPPLPRQHHAPRRATNANMEPIGEGRGRGQTQANTAGPVTTTTTTVAPIAAQPKPEARVVYEAAPVIKDLRKEAVRKFVPTAVRIKQEAVKGQPGRLVEPEEMDRLEKEGYLPGAAQTDQPAPSVEPGAGIGFPTTTALPPTEADTSKSRTVQVEDVEDEDI